MKVICGGLFLGLTVDISQRSYHRSEDPFVCIPSVDRLSGCRLFHCFALSPFRLWFGRLFLPTGEALGSYVACNPDGKGTVVEGGFVVAVASFVEVTCVHLKLSVYLYCHHLWRCLL